VRTCAPRTWMLICLLTAATLPIAESAVAAATPARVRVPLVGTFRLAAGSCDPVSHAVTGSYFRLIFPNGSSASGPYFENANSFCVDKSYTILKPGSEGGLVSGRFQPNPTPPFTGNGGGRANEISVPVSLGGINLALSTNSTDPQTRHVVPTPTITNNDGQLTGQVQAMSVAWNKNFINQGSPKPGGTRLGLTQPVTGTYDPKTRAYSLTWTSQIAGGPFTRFTGYWHLSGTFTTKRIVNVPNLTTSTTPFAHVTTTTGIHKGKPQPTKAIGVSKNVRLVNCNSWSGGWSAGGAVHNPSSQPATYRIAVAFISTDGSRLATSSTTVSMRPGQTTLWSTGATFPVNGAVRCRLQGAAPG
jgi:hypothetical protein